MSELPNGLRSLVKHIVAAKHGSSKPLTSNELWLLELRIKSTRILAPYPMHYGICANRLLRIRPFYKARAPVRLCLPVTQESTKSLKALLVLHAKTFELTKPSIMQVIILK